MSADPRTFQGDPWPTPDSDEPGENTVVQPPDRPSSPQEGSSGDQERSWERSLTRGKIRGEPQHAAPELLVMGDEVTSDGTIRRIGFGPVPAGRIWVVERIIMLSTNGGAAFVGRVYVTRTPAAPGRLDVRGLISDARAGTESPGKALLARGSERVVCEWQTVANLDVLTATIQVISIDIHDLAKHAI